MTTNVHKLLTHHPLVWDPHTTTLSLPNSIPNKHTMRLLTTVALFALSVSQTVLAAPCIAFDADWNLYAFGLNGKDYNAGTQDKWTGSAYTLE